MRRLPIRTLLAFTTALSVGCAELDKGDGQAPFELHLSPGGKADGAGILSPEDLARIEEAFDTALAEGEQAIDALEDEIARLEQENAARLAEIDALVAQIERRRSELEDQHRQNLFLCVLFPDPSICALAVIIANDSRMQELESRLAAARSEQSRVQRDLADYEERRDDLRARIEPLRDARERLVALYRNGVPLSAVPSVLEPGSPEATAYSRADALGRIAAATREEIDLLVEIRDAAAELQASLDSALATIRALATDVDALVQDARDHFMDLLEALTAEDPAAIARDWLDEAIASRTRAMLDALDWPVREFVEHLVATRPGDEVDLDQLAQDLLDALLAGDAAVFTSTTTLAILDNTAAAAPILVSSAGARSTAEVTVRIEHTYVGDLRVWVEHGGREWVLHDRTGGATDDLTATYALELPPGHAADGTWRLHIADEASADEGRLLGWDLVLR